MGNPGGFTGTRQGMSDFQMGQLFGYLLRFKIKEFHHGDCLGADAQADKIARALGCKIFIHPPVDDKYRAFCARPGDTVYEAKPYLERDDDIVIATKVLFAAPKSDVEERRSGTWYTIRKARKLGKKIVMLRRD